MKQKTTKDRIINWARWARGGPTRPTGSMTGTICDNMRMAAMGSISTGAGGAGDRLDSEDAALVERMWKTLAPKHRELLRWHYIRDARPDIVCRRLGIKPRPTSIFDIELARAEAALATALADAGTRYHAVDRRA
jgi:hypothetical protein